MIDHVRLRNFKCFQDETIHFGGLTVLSGLNGAGKSSVLQAVLALRQRWGPIPVSPWRGSLVHPGPFREVLHSDALNDTLRIEASFFDGRGKACIEDGPCQRDGEGAASGFELVTDAHLPRERRCPTPIGTQRRRE